MLFVALFNISESNVCKVEAEILDLSFCNLRVLEGQEELLCNLIHFDYAGTSEGEFGLHPKRTTMF